ncbi:hypothetical protein [Nocardioides sp. cx-173]|uniref:hypothetical protein n=1 Tax=Nocardioides sp. cx-173 TaxID=2898796 RepID=UPI001E2BCF0B|nr:hypothetical protein [Nocardioides sp. cx-173]MCD4526701.1 hypothetical protein [Nocardioides sp. cx-173]UGB42557.1 hypothetical protein LQ940_03290 [Nocardioides sp. cx-173]
MSDGNGRNDPNQPGYQAPYDPSDTRDVGSGKDFGADLYDLYTAGRVAFPEKAALFSGWASSAHDFAQRTQFLADSVGRERSVLVVESIREQLHFALRDTSITMRDIGAALVQVATDFAQTDEAASAEFNRLAAADPLLSAPTPQVPVPPGSDAPYSTPYAAPSLEAPEPETPWPFGWLEGQVDDAVDGVRSGVIDPLQDGLGEVVDAMEGSMDQEKTS